LFIVLFISDKLVTFKIVNVKRIGKGTSIKQDLSTIKEKVKLYAYMLLILILNRVKLSTLPLIY
jgi:hypothetical protein